jgi:hypothetical protein
MPTLNMLHIFTNPELYTIAIGGVVEGIALDIEQARPAPMIGGTTEAPDPEARAIDAAIGHAISAAAVFDAA